MAITKHDNPKIGMSALTLRQEVLWAWIQARHAETGRVPRVSEMIGVDIGDGVRFQKGDLENALTKFVLLGLLETGPSGTLAKLRMAESLT